jgi:hypothetical protein
MKSKLKASGSTTYFDVGDHVIEVFMSSFSGREIIRVDDQELSSRRNWHFRSDHEFELDGDAYLIRITIISLLKGQARVELQKNGAYLDHDEIDYDKALGKGKHSTPVSLLIIAGWGLLGGFAGYFGMKALINLLGSGDVG